MRCQVRPGEVAFACFGQTNRTRTFQWLAEESTSGLDRACVLLTLFQPWEPLPRENSCGLETWHYLFALYNPPCSFPLPLLFGITARIRGTECFCGTVAVRPMSPSSENNRLSDTGGHWQTLTSRRSSTEGQQTPDGLSGVFMSLFGLGEQLLIDMFAVNMSGLAQHFSMT